MSSRKKGEKEERVTERQRNRERDPGVIVGGRPRDKRREEA